MLQHFHPFVKPQAGKKRRGGPHAPDSCSRMTTRTTWKQENGADMMTSPFRETLEQTLTHALTYLETLSQHPVGATATLAELRQRLNKPLPDAGMQAAQVIEELVDD